MMHSMGLEPTPSNLDMNLNHARMPIPPRVLTGVYYNSKCEINQ